MLELSAQPLRLASFAHSSHRSGNRVASARVMRKQITFVTGNLKKREEVVAILAAGGELPFDVVARRLHLQEVQGLSEDIAREKCCAAASLVQGPVITEDTSLCFNAMGGLPGAFIKWFLEELGSRGLPKMLAGFDDKSAYAQCIFAYAAGPREEPQLFVGRTEGRIVNPRGPTDFGWDPVFEPEGFMKTYAEMSKEQKNSISHRYRALDKLRDFLKKEFEVDAAATS